MKRILIVLILFLTGCVGIPENVKPVDNFKLEKYMGKWYEIARLDHSFERGLEILRKIVRLSPDGKNKSWTRICVQYFLYTREKNIGRCCLWQRRFGHLRQYVELVQEKDWTVTVAQRLIELGQKSMAKELPLIVKVVWIGRLHTRVVSGLLGQVSQYLTQWVSSPVLKVEVNGQKILRAKGMLKLQEKTRLANTPLSKEHHCVERAWCGILRFATDPPSKPAGQPVGRMARRASADGGSNNNRESRLR